MLMIRNTTKINPELLENSGVTIEEILKRQIMDLFHKMTLDQLMEFVCVEFIDPRKPVSELREMYNNGNFPNEYLETQVNRLKLGAYGDPQMVCIESTVSVNVK